MRWLAVRGCRDLGRRSSDRRRSVARIGRRCQPSSGVKPAGPPVAGRCHRPDGRGCASSSRSAADDAQARAIRAGTAARSVRPAGSPRGPASRGRARGGRSGERRRARRRPAAGGRWRGRAPGGTPPGCRMSIGNSMSRRQRLHSSASAVCRSAWARMPRFVRRSRTRPSIGSGEPEVLAEIDRDAGDLVDAVGARVIGEQPGDVPGERPVVRPARRHRGLLDGSAASSSHRSPAPPSSRVVGLLGRRARRGARRGARSPS